MHCPLKSENKGELDLSLVRDTLGLFGGFFWGGGGVFNAPFNNISAISWRSVLLVEDSGVPGENHRPVAGH